MGDSPPSEAALAQAQIRLMKLLAQLIVRELRADKAPEIGVRPLDYQSCDERMHLSCKRRRSKR